MSDELYSFIERQVIEARMSPADLASLSLDQYVREQHGTRGTRGTRGTQRKERGQTKKRVAELQAARERFERHFGSVDLGYATGLSNEDIDIDLEDEYAELNERA